MDLARSPLFRGKYVYIMSFDMAGAFDSAPHFQLAQALARFGIDVHTRRSVRNWLRQRVSRVKLRTATGGVYGDPDQILAGRPQGEILSHLLWMAFFHGIHTERGSCCGEAGLPTPAFPDFFFADDVAIVALARAVVAIRQYTRFSMTAAEKGLGKHHSPYRRPERRLFCCVRRSP